MITGVVTAVDRVWSGGTLSADVTAAATVLPLDDAGDFDEEFDEPRYLVIGEETAPREYVAVENDEDLPNTVTLAAAVGATYEAGLPVVLWDPEAEGAEKRAIEFQAWVQLDDQDDAESIQATIPHDMVPTAGLYALVGARVSLAEWDEDDWYVAEVHGRNPVIDVAYIPEAATKQELDAVLDSANGKNAIRWSTDPPPDPPESTSIDGDLWWQRGLDGETGLPTDALVGLWRFDGTAWQPQQLGSETIAYLDAGVITAGSLTGVTVQTRSEVDRGVKLGYVSGQEGLFVYDDTGAIFLKAVPAEGMAVVAGEVKARSLTVSSNDPGDPPGSSLGGTTEIAAGGSLRLRRGTTAPASAPTVTYGYDTVQFANDGKWNTRGGRGLATDGTYWYTVRANGDSPRLERWAHGGSVVAWTEAPAVLWMTPVGVTVLGAYIYVLCEDWTNSTDGEVLRFDASTLAFIDRVPWTHRNSAKRSALGADAATGELLIAQVRESNGNKVRIRRYTYTTGGLTAGSFVDTADTYNNNLSGVWYGSGDFGGNRYVISGDLDTQGYRPYTTAGVYQTNESWPTGMDADKVGFTHDGISFVAMDRNGLMRTYTGIWSTTDANMTKWVRNTLAQGATPTYETTQSPRAKIVMAKRSKLIVTTSPIAAGGDADRVRVYVGQGSTDPGRTGMWLQATPAAGVTTVQLTSLVTSGTNPPATNNFPSGTAAVLDTPDALDAGGFPMASVDAAGNVGRDTGALLATSPFTGSARFLRFGKMVHLYGAISRATGSSAGFTATGIVVPVGMRPAADTFFEASPIWVNGAPTGQYQIVVRATGSIDIRQTQETTQTMPVSGVYFID